FFAGKLTIRPLFADKKLWDYCESCRRNGVKRLRRKKTIAAFLVFLLFVAQSGVVHAATSELTKLVLNKTELALEIGDSATLTAIAVHANGKTEDVTIYAD